VFLAVVFQEEECPAVSLAWVFLAAVVLPV
jgi:hypothetical protein